MNKAVWMALSICMSPVFLSYTMDDNELLFEMDMEEEEIQQANNHSIAYQDVTKFKNVSGSEVYIEFILHNKVISLPITLVNQESFNYEGKIAAGTCFKVYKYTNEKWELIDDYSYNDEHALYEINYKMSSRMMTLKDLS